MRGSSERKMRTDFSKPLGDIAPESDDWFHADRERKLRQDAFLRAHPAALKRSICLLCGQPLAGDAFIHRQVSYIHCGHCGHIQDEYMLPPSATADFSTVYPPLSQTEHASRVRRVYAPKLEWIVRRLKENGLADPLARKWCEIGCGAGYFLDALRQAGAGAFQGIEADPALAARARSVAGDERVLCSEDAGKAVAASTAGIYVSFFVLEHLDDPGALLDVLAAKPSGTVFAFAVPVFGLSTLLEGLFPEFAARSLDGMTHRQMFTDRSISFLLERIGYAPAAQWVFGQDAADAARMFRHGARKLFPKALAGRCEEALYAMRDSLQQAVDQNFFSDARHVLAVKS